MSNTLDIKGVFELEIRHPDGTVEVIPFNNTVTREGKAYLLRAGVTGEATPTSGWYIGLMGNNATVSETDTASVCLGSSGTYGEITSYSETTRRTYQAVYSGSLNNINNNANPASFTINASATIYGAFITNTSTKLSNNGILLCAGKLNNAQPVSDGAVISLRYSISTATT